MKKIVLTGGPCAGKSTVLAVLQQQFAGQVLVVPEAATMLLSSGFPLPGRDLAWSPEWQTAFQTAIAALQPQLERAYELQAVERGARILICDRGLLDGAAYTPGGLDEFCRRYAVALEEARARYASIFHLESCATGAPEFYGTAGNEVRMEAIEEAIALEHKTRAAWQGHPEWIFLSCVGGVEGKIRAACQTLRALIGESR